MDVLHQRVEQSNSCKSAFRAVCLGVTTFVLLIYSSAATAQSDTAQADTGQSDTGPTTPLQDPPAALDDSEIAPYVVFVAKADAHVRSGPGNDHYRTDPVRRGQELEVYVETADGWLGIRPPEKSFCWIPAADTNWQEGNSVAAITEDETIAWIGTRLGSARRYRWQVQLETGETVNVLGSAERSGKPWLRIAPPSGEFRWIHTDDVADNAEQLLQIAQAEDRAALAEQQVESADDLVPRDTASRSASNESTNERNLASQPFSDSGKSIVQAGNLDRPNETVANMSSSRRGSGTATLTEIASAPEFESAPTYQPTANERVPDKAFQFHRDANVNDFADRGAVIGSGLREDLFPKSPEATDNDPAIQTAGLQDITNRSAEAASSAANAIVSPIRKVTDVVANFISPPRVVEIDGSRNRLAPANDPLAERPWISSSNTRDTLRSPIGANAPASVAQVNFQRSQTPIRIVPLSKISKVEDSVSGAGPTELQRILSQLMAEAASASEVDPLLRRAQTLLNSGDFNATTQIRKLIETAQQYRSVAVRRDGTTRIDTSMAAMHVPAVIHAQGQSNGSHAGANMPSNLLTHSGMQPATLVAPSAVPKDVPATAAGTAVGTLVKVYSSRPNMPPFVLTDEAGLTVAYVTPYPGVNLATHLNSRVAVRGNEKLLQGMAMPHIMVDAVTRR